MKHICFKSILRIKWHSTITPINKLCHCEIYDFVYLYFNFRYAREFPDPYLGHGIGPVPGYGVCIRQHIHLLQSNSFTIFFVFAFYRRRCIEEVTIALRHINHHFTEIVYAQIERKRKKRNACIDISSLDISRNQAILPAISLKEYQKKKKIILQKHYTQE